MCTLFTCIDFTTDTLLATPWLLFLVLSFNRDWREGGTSSDLSLDTLTLDLSVLHSLTTNQNIPYHPSNAYVLYSKPFEYFTNSLINQAFSCFS